MVLGFGRYKDRYLEQELTWTNMVMSTHQLSGMSISKGMLFGFLQSLDNLNPTYEACACGEFS